MRLILTVLILLCVRPTLAQRIQVTEPGPNWGARRSTEREPPRALRSLRPTGSPLGMWTAPPLPAPGVQRDTTIRPAGDGRNVQFKPARPVQPGMYGGQPNRETVATVGRFRAVTPPNEQEMMAAAARDFRARIERDEAERAQERARLHDASAFRDRDRARSQETPYGRVDPDQLRDLRRTASEGCPGGGTCGNLRTATRTVDGARPGTGSDGVAVWCAAGTTCRSRLPEPTRAVAQVRTHPSGLRRESLEVTVTATDGGASARSGGRAPSVAYGPAGRLTQDLLDRPGLDPEVRQAAGRAAAGRSLWRAGGGEVYVGVEPGSRSAGRAWAPTRIPPSRDPKAK